MTREFVFWLLMILWLLFGGASRWPKTAGRCPSWAGNLILFVLLALLGWAV